MEITFIVVVFLATSFLNYHAGYSRAKKGSIYSVPKCPNDKTPMDRISYTCPVCKCSTAEERSPAK